MDDVLTVKLAGTEDAEALAEILTSGVNNKVAHGDMAWGTEPYTAEELRERVAKGRTYIAKLGDEPVGTFALLWEDERVWGEQPPVAGYLHQLAVKDGYRGMHLGRRLLDWAGHYVAQSGRQLLRIDFPPDNVGLKTYYEKLGFKWIKDSEVSTPHTTYSAALYERPAQ